MLSSVLPSIEYSALNFYLSSPVNFKHGVRVVGGKPSADDREEGKGLPTYIFY